MIGRRTLRSGQRLALGAVSTTTSTAAARCRRRQRCAHSPLRARPGGGPRVWPEVACAPRGPAVVAGVRGVTALAALPPTLDGDVRCSSARPRRLHRCRCSCARRGRVRDRGGVQRPAGCSAPPVDYPDERARLWRLLGASSRPARAVVLGVPRGQGALGCRPTRAAAARGRAARRSPAGPTAPPRAGAAARVLRRPRRRPSTPRSPRHRASRSARPSRTSSTWSSGSRPAREPALRRGHRGRGQASLRLEPTRRCSSSPTCSGSRSSSASCAEHG